MSYKIPDLVHCEKCEKIKKELFEPYLVQDNILVASYFGSWCLLVLDQDYNIVSKYWSEKEKVLKCFTNYIKNLKIDLNILGVKRFKNKNVKNSIFRIDLEMRNFIGDEIAMDYKSFINS